MSVIGTGGFGDVQELVGSHVVREVGREESPTLLEIAGFAHWEDVYSNILAFFLDTGQAHGFGPLFLRSVVAAYRCECGERGWLADVAPPEFVEATEAVEREVRTSADKRIDVVVDCAEFRICIENKIGAGLYNDLGEYRRHCEEDGNGRPVVGIVLSPHGVASPALARHRFASVTYGDLVEQVRRRMGSHLGGHNTRYQYLLFDFLEQASRLSRTSSMNDDEQAFLAFWRENVSKIGNLEAWIGKMWELLDADGKAAAHRERCRALLADADRAVFRDRTYQRRVAVFDLAEGGTVDGCGLYLDVEFHPLRVVHVLGKRRGREPTVLADGIDARCGTRFGESPVEAGRIMSAVEESPLDDSVCESAVRTSVRILEYVAARRRREDLGGRS